MIKEAAKKYLQDANSAVEHVNVADLAPEDLGNWLIIDVREDSEYAAGHLPGAISMPRSRLEMLATQSDILEASEDKPTLVYCGSGKRSVLAAHTLKALGMQRTVSMDGGYAAWGSAGKRGG